MKKSSKGFTTIELIMVIAITLVVIGMVCTFTLILRQQSNIIAKNSATISEVNTFKKVVKDFVRSNDNSNREISIASTTKLKSSEGGASKETLEFTSNAIIWKKGDTVHKKYKFEQISSCGFTNTKSSLVYCNIKTSLDEIKFSFNVFSKTNRQRFSTNERYVA